MLRFITVNIEERQRYFKLIKQAIKQKVVRLKGGKMAFKRIRKKHVSMSWMDEDR